MPGQSGKIVLVLVLLLLFLGIAVYFLSSIVKKENPQQDSQMETETVTETSQSKNRNHSSEELKISFEYSKDWFVNEKNYFLMVTSYETKIGRNEQPNESQIEIDIHNPGGCHETIDENLKDPSCGELGPKARNQIVSKEIEDINGAKFYKYVVKYPSGQQVNFYFLEKGERVLQIDKKPDPSQFETEFEELVKSLKFD